LVHQHGLAGYYELKDQITAPADPAVFQPRDYGWLDREQARAEADAEMAKRRLPELELSLQGISCAGCVWLIERLFMQLAGARSAVANAQTGGLRLRWLPGEFKASDFARKIQAFGYLIGPAGEDATELESRGLVKRIGLCAAFQMNIMLFTLPSYFGMESSFEYARLFGTISLALGTLSLLVGGTYFMGRAFRALREGAMHIDLPIALGIAGAYLGSLYGWFVEQERFVYWDFVGTFILLMLIGRWAQVAAVENNRRRLLRQQLQPPRVQVQGPDGAALEVPPDKLGIGQRFRLASGQSIPVESSIESGEQAFSLASINGESEPRVFRAGERVPAGAVSVGREATEMRAEQLWKDSLFARLMQSGERAGGRHELLERIVRGYLIGIFAIALLAGIGWWLASGSLQHTWAVVTAILVVSCPCAIGLAFPLADEMASVALRRRGVYVREDDLWAKLAKVRTIIFDKTGTLTLETPELTTPEALEALSAQERAILLALVRGNAHPVSQALLAELLGRRQLCVEAAQEALPTGAPDGATIREQVGQGVELLTQHPASACWRLGKRPFALEPAGHALSDEAGRLRAGSAGENEAGAVHFTMNGRVLAVFRFEDRPRADARAELGLLRERGFDVHILSGDHPGKVARLGAELGLPADCLHAGKSPEEKLEWMKSHDHQDTLMLGDGANDSLAFDRAYCRGTPVIHRGLLERKADFYYLGRGIGGIRALFECNRIRLLTQGVIAAFSIVYNLLAVGLAVAGLMNPLVAAVMMPLNSLLSLVIVTLGMRPAFRP
jgi:Cu2+-exporting ATPase